MTVNYFTNPWEHELNITTSLVSQIWTRVSGKRLKNWRTFFLINTDVLVRTLSSDAINLKQHEIQPVIIRTQPGLFLWLSDQLLIHICSFLLLLWSLRHFSWLLFAFLSRNFFFPPPIALAAFPCAPVWTLLPWRWSRETVQDEVWGSDEKKALFVHLG